MSTQVPDIPQPGLRHSQRGSGDTSSVTLKSSQGARKGPLVPASWSFRSGLQRARGSSTLPGTVLEENAEACSNSACTKPGSGLPQALALRATACATTTPQGPRIPSLSPGKRAASNEEREWMGVRAWGVFVCPFVCVCVCVCGVSEASSGGTADARNEVEHFFCSSSLSTMKASMLDRWLGIHCRPKQCQGLGTKRVLEAPFSLTSADVPVKEVSTRLSGLRA